MPRDSAARNDGNTRSVRLDLLQRNSRKPLKRSVCRIDSYNPEIASAAGIKICRKER